MTRFLTPGNSGYGDMNHCPGQEFKALLDRRATEADLRLVVMSMDKFLAISTINGLRSSYDASVAQCHVSLLYMTQEYLLVYCTGALVGTKEVIVDAVVELLRDPPVVRAPMHLTDL
jgi:hypothetical protein